MKCCYSLFFICQRRQLSSNTNKTSVISQFKNNTCVESDDEDEHEDNAVQTIDEHSDNEDEEKDSEVDLQWLDEEITSIVTKVHDNGGKHTAIISAVHIICMCIYVIMYYLQLHNYILRWTAGVYIN